MLKAPTKRTGTASERIEDAHLKQPEEPEAAGVGGQIKKKKVYRII